MTKTIAAAPAKPWRVWLAGVALVVATVVAYQGSLNAPFVFDDPAAITHNPSIRRLASLGEVMSPPANGSGVMGRPVVNLSLALNYAFGGTQPRGYHVLNVVLHTAAALAAFGLLRRTLQRPEIPPRLEAAALPLAFLSAMAWALHPLQTESVTCIIQRTELLVGLWYLLTLYTFVRAAEAVAPGRWFALSVVACYIGMASKEVMVSAPILVFFYDRTFVAGSFATAWRRRRTYYLALASSWLLLVALVASGSGGRGAAAGFGLGITPWSYLVTQCEALVLYAKLALWPHPLVLDYGTAVAPGLASVLPQALTVVLALGGTAVALRRWPRVGFLGLWFFALLAPSSSVVPLVTQTIAEHRMYLPLLAPLVGLTAAACAALGARGGLFAMAAVVALGITTSARNRVYRDELTIWADTRAKRPDNPRAHASYALALSERGRHTDAIPVFEQSLQLDSRSATTHLNLANACLQAGDAAKAIRHYRRALEIDAKFTPAHNSLAVALQNSGDMEGALQHYHEALRLDPNLFSAHKNLAGALFKLGRFAEAATHYKRVLELAPSAEAHYNLGLALLRNRDLDAAIPHFDEVLRLQPHAAGYAMYGRLLADAGRAGAAIQAYEAALRLQPGFAEAQRELQRLRAIPPSASQPAPKR